MFSVAKCVQAEERVEKHQKEHMTGDIQTVVDMSLFPFSPYPKGHRKFKTMTETWQHFRQTEGQE